MPRLPGQALISQVPRLTPHEIAWGWPYGEGESSPRPRVNAAAAAPRQRFEEAVLKALLRPPAVVSFSGGRDSSAVLAVAAKVARREGLAMPVALTRRHPGDPLSEESQWQEMVISHLGVADWVKVDVRGELDVVGPVGSGLLRAVGHPFFPPGLVNLGFLAQHAPGATVVTGEFGDHMLGRHRLTGLHNVLSRRGRVSRAGWKAAATSLFPGPVRSRLEMRADEPYAWLRPQTEARRAACARRDIASEPLSWADSLWRLLSMRFYLIGMQTRAAIADHLGLRFVDPFVDEKFVAQLAAVGGRLGLLSRTAAMRLLFSDLLPDELLRRTTKAYFNNAFVGVASKAFAETWNGEGVDTELVDPEALRETWLAEPPHAMAVMLLQQAWLYAETAAEPVP